MRNVLIIDNFDSFTHNLAYEFRKRGCNAIVMRNNIPLRAMKQKIKESQPRLIVISPGPGSPATAGNSMEIIRLFNGKIPILGICLGHQCIVEAFGGKIRKAHTTVHGKSSLIKIKGHYAFRGLGGSLRVGRYHSLIGSEIPEVLEAIAETEDGEIMAVSHRKMHILGLQFHPESILTPEGGKIIENILEECGGLHD